MLDTEREARKYRDGDSGWTAGKRAFKAYRQMALMPDEEVPPHKKKRKKRKATKHVHEYGEIKWWVGWSPRMGTKKCLICGRRLYVYTRR